MPSIYLGMQSSSFTLASVTITEETDPKSLFKKFKHTPPSSDKSREIYLFKTGWSISYYWSNCATLQPGLEYENSRLEHAEVYFNKFDKTSTALVCFLKFDKGPSRIYKHSEHGTYIDGHKNTPITTLTQFNSGENILDEVLKENDKLDIILTYDIGRKDGDNNGDGNGTYNGGKIKLEDDTSGDPNLESTGFRRYKHTPATGNDGKKACVIWNKNLLLDKGGKTELPNIQDQPYEHINVYYSDKVFEPLLVELNENGSSSNTSKYYYHTWKDNDGDDGKTLYWKEITKGGNVLNVQLDYGNDVHSALTGAGNGKLAELLKAIEAHLQKTIVFMIDKKEGQYEHSTFKLSFDKSSNYRLINKEITPKDKTSSGEGQCLEKTGFKIYEHDFTTSVSGVKDGKEKVELIFLVPNSESADTYQEIKLYKGATDSNGNVETLEYKSPNKNLYVYFYGEKDPRPLLVCYNDCAYKPRNLNSANKETQVNVKYSEWHKVGYITSCVCTGTDTTDGTPNQEILKALTQITGFLNPVQINPNEIPGSARTTITARDGTQQYELHTYPPDKTIKMGITRQDIKCYKSFKYEPYGTKGSVDNTFRLGTVFHAKTSESHKHSTLEYINETSYKYYPLVGVTVYYYDEDKGYDDPLLIELEFRTNGVGGASNEKEYYKLTQAGGDPGYGTLQWAIDNTASSAIGVGDGVGGGAGNDKLIAHLDSIRHSLKKVIKILLDKQQTYGLYWSTNPGGKGNGYTQDPGTNKIEVSQYTENGCDKLKSAGYVCYVHKVSEINSGVRFDYNQIGGLKFYISGTNSGGGDTSGDQDIPIPLYDDSGTSPLPHITYNKCMGDVYVYFYAKHSTKPVDDVPLMLKYNGGYYSPQDRDQYFKEWSYQRGLEVVTTPCGSETEGEEAGDSYQLLEAMLDLTNTALNRIDLTHTITSGSTSEYGIPTTAIGPKKPDIDVNRVDVTKIHSKTPETRPYCKLVHRTMNSFDIGDIYYKTQDITKGGVQINGSGTGGSINVDRSTNHTKFVNPPGDNNPNTVVAYYHKDDSTHKLPQLIVLLQTDGPIDTGTDPITASRDTKYGYYVLATNGNGGGTNTYKYEWRTPDDAPLTLDEKTEFKLLNSIIILVDKQQTYQENVISSALTNSASIRSPGLIDDVNRFKEKTINVAEETRNDRSTYGGSGQCISQYGYKLYAHDITALVEWKPNGQPSIPLIAGLRFLVPSSETATGYDEIKLYQNDSTTGSVDRLYHTPANKNKVYIFFYGSDPRPLLLCYGGNAYKPKKKLDPIQDRQVMVEYTSWTRVTNISQCNCMGAGVSGNDNNIVNALLEVVCFLNPVQINPKMIPTNACKTITGDPPKPPPPTSAEYDLHKFTATQTVKMKITRTDIHCYEKYTYEPNGTSGGKTGFRLGSVHYSPSNHSSKINKLEYNTLTTQYSNHPLVKATVFYYDHDTKYEEPLLIELEFNTNGGVGVGSPTNPKEYYKLKSLINTDGTDMKWDKDPEAQTQIGDGKDNQKIVTYLDTIRYQFKKVLQVCIAIKKSDSYEAKLLNRENDKSVEPNEHISVQVTEEKTCPSLTGTGFRCFKHNITGLGSPDLHKFAALQFFIPDKDSTNLVKINLHELSTSGPTDPLYYNCGMGDIYVYFYGTGSGGTDQNDGDPRPLLLCYNSTAYRAFNIALYDIQRWFKAPKVQNCSCDKKFENNLLVALVRVTNFLNPVKLNITQGIYKIHTFRGEEIRIKVESVPSQNKFCYNRYTHSHEKPGFRLGNIIFNSKIIVEKDPPNKLISSLINEKPKYEPASEVIVYYYRGDPSHQNPLLVVLCKKANEGTNGINTSCTCKPYYELQRSSTKTDKKYEKHSNNLNLDTRKGGQLETILDRILFNISKRLQIILGKRLEPIQLCPIERKRIKKFLKATKPFEQLNYPQIGSQLIIDTVVVAADMTQSVIDEGFFSYYNPKSYDYINENDCTTRENNEWDPKFKTRIPSYPARVYKNDGTRESGDSGSTQIKVQKIESKELANTGYVCYQHLLTQIKDIDNFGGLRLFLWDNRKDTDTDDTYCKVIKSNHLSKRKCCEIKLATCSYVQEIDLPHIPYTTCKGDLYVYFYGSDPRPMLLCYNNESYAPQSMDEYNQKWCLVKQIPSCECDDKTGFKPEQLLQQLYQISMFLNPVNLWETLNAYEQVKAEVTRIRKDKKEGKDVPKLGKLPEHVYTVQTFGDTDINIKVKSADLNCYRQYTFESAMGDSGSSVRRDYRLGDIYYGSASDSQRGSDKTCLSYPPNQRLQSVSLYYYMYDSEHRYPLIIQLDYGFGGELDDYYRVCNISAGQGATSGSSNGAGGPGGGASGPAAPPPKPAEIASKITWVKLKCTDTTHRHSQDSASGSPSTSGTNGNCKDDCPKPTDFKGEKIKDEIVTELNENDSRFVKQAHDVQIKTRKLSLGEHPLFGQQYLDLVAELQALIEARCFDVRRKYGIEYPKGEDNKNLILVTDENCYEESIMGYVLGGGALGVAGGGGWKLATFVLTLFIKV